MNRTQHLRVVALTLAATLALAACGGDDDAGAADTTEAMTDESMTDESMTDESMTDESMTDEMTTPSIMAAADLEPGTAELALADGTVYNLTIDGGCDTSTEMAVSFTAADGDLTVSVEIVDTTGSLRFGGMMEAEGRVEDATIGDTGEVYAVGVVTAADDTAEAMDFHLEANCTSG